MRSNILVLAVSSLSHFLKQYGFNKSKVIKLERANFSLCHFKVDTVFH